MTHDERVSRRTLAAEMDVSLATIDRWAREGRLPPKFRWGPNTTGWLRSDIEQWKLERRRAS